MLKGQASFISGVPYFCNASSRQTTQKLLSSVLDNRQVNTLREYQSITADR